jgi:hypothetical protein
MTRRKQLAGPIAAATSLAAVAGLWMAPAAQAHPNHDQVAVVHQMATSSSARARVSGYWTPARMRAAKPLKVKPASGWKRTKVAAGKPTVVKGTKQHKPKPSAPSSLGGPWTGGGQVVKTTGKVFMTLRGVDYVCSGSVVPSDNKSLVTTAGHCVNEGPGAYVSNFEFVPGYHNGSAPYGEWTATSVATTNQWAKQGDFNYDVGFAIVGPLNGKYLTDAVGSQSIGFNQTRAQQTFAFGYPAAAPYKGGELDYSSGVTGNDPTGQTNDLRLASNMTGGSSGGPWFEKFATSGGTGTQVSVTSFGYTNERNALYGPYFGSVIQSAYNQEQSAA